MCSPSRIPAPLVAVAVVVVLVAPALVAGSAPTSDVPSDASEAPHERAAVSVSGAVAHDGSPSTDDAHGVLIEGTVTDEAGRPVEEAYVLVQANGEEMLQNATAGDDPIRQSLFELVDEHPYGLYWNATTDEGRYSVHVPRPADYEVIAVSRAGVSRLRDVSVRVQGEEQNLTVDPDRVLSVESNDPSAAPGEVATVELRVPNPGDEPVEQLSVALSPPAGWSIEGVETAGDWDADVRRVTFERVGPGGVATATVRVRVPEGAARDPHDVAVTADARTHFVEHGDVQVRVAPPDAATPTLTPTGTDERFTFDSPSRPGDSRPTALYLLSASVFAVGVAFAGYSVWRTGPPR